MPPVRRNSLLTLWTSALSRDAKLILAARSLRTLGYGCTSVLLASMLSDDGCTPAQIGALVAVASAGSVSASLLMGFFADRWGRRRSLVVSAVLMAGAGCVFALSESYPVLVLAAFLGTISPSTNDNTPFSGVEQAILAQTGRPPDHTRIFTAYNVTALLAGAAGALVAALLGQLPGVPAGDAAFLAYAMLAVATVAVCLRLSPDVEVPASSPRVRRRPSPRPRPASPNPSNAQAKPGPLPGRVRWLAALFAVDAFAGGLAVQTMLAWWLQHQYAATPTELGLLFFAANLLSAVSQLAAPTLAGRHGLLATMLVPHAISNVLLLCVPLAPNLATAAVLLLARHAFSKIDVPARQAFTAAIVGPTHRTAAASVTSVARSVAVCASPMACSALLTGRLAAVGAPLLVAGGLAISYDTALWRSFRRQPATPHRTATGARKPETSGDRR